MASHLVPLFHEDRYFHFECPSYDRTRFDPRHPTYMGVILKKVDVDKRWFERWEWAGDGDVAIVVQSAESGSPHLILTKQETLLLVQCFEDWLEDSTKKYTLAVVHSDGSRGTVEVSELFTGVLFKKTWPGNVRSVHLEYPYARRLVETIKKALSA